MLNEATSEPVAAGVQVELGGFQPEQIRSLVLRFTPKQASRPGRRKVAMLRLDYVLADDLSEHSVSTSVWARVARDDERDAVVDADVMAEVLFQRVQRRKRAGMQALSMGDWAEAERIFERVGPAHQAPLGLASRRARRDEFAAEIDFIDGLNARAGEWTVRSDMAFASKLMSADIIVKSRTPWPGPRVSAFHVIPGDPRSSVIVHVPHSSRFIPPERAGRASCSTTWRSSVSSTP